MSSVSSNKHEIRQVILGSRSPQRRSLLALLVRADCILVRPPANPQEEEFAGLSEWSAISARLRDIVATKLNAVLMQCTPDELQNSLVLTADTAIIAPAPRQAAQPLASLPVGHVPAEAPRFEVLGQPPEDATGHAVVQEWFTTRLAGRTHWAMTAVCWREPSGNITTRLATTAVTFRSDVAIWLPFFLDSGEPRGKAGGYGLQGLGSLFIERVEGSLTNVIGLPLEVVLPVLQGSGAGAILNTQDPLPTVGVPGEPVR